jgi:hypothetical protein
MLTAPTRCPVTDFESALGGILEHIANPEILVGVHFQARIIFNI